MNIGMLTTSQCSAGLGPDGNCQFNPRMAAPFYVHQGRKYCYYHAPLDAVEILTETTNDYGTAASSSSIGQSIFLYRPEDILPPRPVSEEEFKIFQGRCERILSSRLRV